MTGRCQGASERPEGKALAGISVSTLRVRDYDKGLKRGLIETSGANICEWAIAVLM